MRTVSEPDWPAEFAKVISCLRCDTSACKKMLRDDGENVPQPGFIGERFHERRILLVGQNPAIPKSYMAARDRIYTAALRHVRDDRSAENWAKLQEVLLEFVPDWPVQRRYFPLKESGLTLPEIAYCNIVRCRTKENGEPSVRMISECADNHFVRWLDLLKPRAIVFIGKWAYDEGSHYARDRQIPCGFMNRWRSLPRDARAENREQVVALVRDHAG